VINFDASRYSHKGTVQDARNHFEGGSDNDTV
jgi:hypothetical protein